MLCSNRIHFLIKLKDNHYTNIRIINKIISRISVRGAYYTVFDLLSAARQLIYNGYIKICINDDSKRSRYRSCTHDKSMRISALLLKLLPLLYAESVLLIGADKPELFVFRLLLDQRVCTDYYIYISCLKLLVDKSFFLPFSL